MWVQWFFIIFIWIIHFECENWSFLLQKRSSTWWKVHILFEFLIQMRLSMFIFLSAYIWLHCVSVFASPLFSFSKIHRRKFPYCSLFCLWKNSKYEISEVLNFIFRRFRVLWNCYIVLALLKCNIDVV